MKFLTILNFLLLLFCFSLSQTIDLPLQMQPGIGPFSGSVTPTNIDTAKKFKNLPQKIQDYIIKYVDINYKKKDSVNNLEKLRVFFFIGLKSDSIVVIADSNFNLDFSDDVLMTYPIEKKSLQDLPYTTIIIPGSDKKFTFQAYPYHTSFKYYSQIENKFYLMIKSFEYSNGFLPWSNIPIAVINNRLSSVVENQRDISIALLQDNNSKISFYELGDNFTIDKERYIFNSISLEGDTLTMTKVDSAKIQSGISEGLTPDPIIIESIDKEKISIPSANRYILLDFWGTWCNPCHKLVPDVKKIYVQHSEHLNILGIAYDDNKEKVIKYLEKNKIFWPQIFENMKNSNSSSAVEFFRVDTFPTFILINDKGKIVVRGNSKESLNRIDSVLVNVK
ncbi:MAG: TlpA family protein disulfide reductase [Chitinophagaceae bacterium]|nr:TlpA family protein disulfide reductase [Chitinophagaceae bacterium]